MKKLNNEGWGIGTFFAFIILIFFFILIVIIQSGKLGIIGKHNLLVSDQVTVGPTLEEQRNNIIEATSRYIDDANIIFSDTRDIRIVLFSTLISQGYVNNVIVNNENCTGYVIVTNTSTERIKYEPYFKCQTYTTPKYDDNFS